MQNIHEHIGAHLGVLPVEAEGLCSREGAAPQVGSKGLLC